MRRALLVCTVLWTATCGPAGAPGPAVPAGMTVPGLAVPTEVNQDNIELALRRLEDLEQDTEQRASLRSAIIHELARQFDEDMAAGNEERASGAFETALRTHTVEEILASEISPQVSAMARGVRDSFSPLGDEARVMVALLVLGFSDPDDHEIAREYELLVGWTEEARMGLGDDSMRVDDLTSLYEQVAMAIPVPTVTDRLLELYTERQALSEAAYGQMLAFKPSDGIEGLKKAAMAVKTYEQLQPKVRLTSYLLARIFTRLGTPTAALTLLHEGKEGALKTGQVSSDVIDVLESLDADPGDPVNWLALSRLLSSYGDLDLARWASRRGWRLDPWGPTFPLEIGRLYRSQGVMDGATEYMDLALLLDPERPLIYQELMALHLEIVGSALKDGEPEGAASSLDRLEELLADFESRWPAKPSGMHEADLERLRGVAAFQLGDADMAVSHLKKSLASAKEIRALHLLALVQVRTLELDEARKTIARADKYHFKKHGEAYYWKTVMGMLDGDVLALMQHPQEAEKAWKGAVETGLEGLPFVPPDLKPEMEARIGLLLVRIGRSEAGIDHFKRSVASGADDATFELMLSELTARKKVDIAEVVWHFAATDSDLDDDSKLRFCLWSVALQWASGAAAPPGAISLLGGSADGAWPGPLHSLARGETTIEKAAEAAGDDPGHLVCLDFLIGCKLMGEGDAPGAAARFLAILGAGLVADPHHAMAMEMLASMGQLPVK